MMLSYAKYSFLLLLFVLVFLCARQLMLVLWRKRKARYRLKYVRNANITSRLSAYLSRFNIINIHLREILEAVESRLSISSMVTMMFILFLSGTMAGALFFQSLKGVLVLCFIAAAMPYILLRMRLITVRLRIRMEFLPAVEIFYQYYMISAQKNIKVALKTCIEENRMRFPIKSVFEQLYRNLMTQRSVDESLRVFTLTLGHQWADYFSGILKVALHEGNDIGASMKELIIDMRKAQRFDQAERNRLLEIRIANFTPIIFLALFLFINFKVNYANSYQFYVLDPGGRSMLLDAILLIFISFLMGIYLSLKRM
jgi:hypothetical protein